MLLLVFIVSPLSAFESYEKFVSLQDPNDVPSTAAEWAACPHQRRDAIQFAQKYADFNHDGYVCRAEIEQLKADLLTFPERLYLFFMDANSIMRNCAGPNGYVSADDFAQRNRTCLRNCAAVERFFTYFANRALKKNYVGARVECEPPVGPTTRKPSSSTKPPAFALPNAVIAAAKHRVSPKPTVTKTTTTRPSKATQDVGTSRHHKHKPHSNVNSTSPRLENKKRAL